MPGVAASPRVLQLDTERGWRGGQNQVALLHRGLCECGDYSVVVGRAGGELVNRLTAQGLPALAVPVSGSVDPRTLAALARIIRRQRIQVLHAHASHAHSYGLLLARACQLPLVVTRRVDFVPRPGLASQLKYGHRVARLVAISRGVGRALARGGVPPQAIIPSGVDPARTLAGDRARGRAALNLSDEQQLVLNVAALADHKGQSDLLSAWATIADRFPTAVVAIAGDGDRRAALEAQIEAEQIPRCRLLGWRGDIPDLLAAADLFCMSSHEEGLGTSIADAMVAGLAVVATTAGGIPEVVTPETGWLVPPKAPNQLAEALAEALTQPAQRRARGAAGRARAAAHFHYPAMVAAYRALYRQLTTSR